MPPLCASHRISSLLAHRPVQVARPCTVTSVAQRSACERAHTEVPVDVVDNGRINELWAHQKHCIDAIRSERASGCRRQLVSLPTGAGKTVVFAHPAKQLDQRTLVLAHRNELIQQAADKFSRVWPDSDIGILQAACKDFHNQVVIASVQTANRPKTLELLVKQDFKLLIVDEAHHAAAPTYRSIVSALGFDDPDESKLLVGFTATPYRLKKEARGVLDNKVLLVDPLWDVFDKVVFEAAVAQLMDEGILCQVTAQRIMSETTDLSEVQVTESGDYGINQLSVAINSRERNELVAHSYLEHAEGRKAVAFCVDVQHAKDLAAVFQDLGVRAAAVHGKMGEQERVGILQQHSTTEELQVLTSCELLTEGYDDPSVNCILMSRPTRSLGLYTQCVGRGLRRDPNNPAKNCLVLDFTDKNYKLDDKPQPVVWADVKPLPPPPPANKEPAQRTVNILPNEELKLYSNPEERLQLHWLPLYPKSGTDISLITGHHSLKQKLLSLTPRQPSYRKAKPAAYVFPFTMPGIRITLVMAYPAATADGAAQGAPSSDSLLTGQGQLPGRETVHPNVLGSDKGGPAAEKVWRADILDQLANDPIIAVPTITGYTAVDVMLKLEDQLVAKVKEHNMEALALKVRRSRWTKKDATPRQQNRLRTLAVQHPGLTDGCLPSSGELQRLTNGDANNMISGARTCCCRCTPHHHQQQQQHHHHQHQHVACGAAELLQPGTCTRWAGAGSHCRQEEAQAAHSCQNQQLRQPRKPSGKAFSLRLDR